ncbi:hypothetical protein AGRA3207_002388 [Actinomadura graeca]|uniref:histidine kinase n=1 Tax=Actinomadura graeca TaxID=2750812 RepID=A0ABX8QS12_9ACTN|nr:histidine kinase [Actinomadura graeca]QXJ21527.1 hypothetical protein AGRA3207_002388 [Actinomadura graeca]
MVGASVLAGVVWSRRQHTAREVGAAVHGERRRIARELHDTVGHGMLLISMSARRLPLAAPRAKPVAEAIDDAVHTTMNDVRRLVGELREGPGTGTGRVRGHAWDGAAEPGPGPTLAGGITELGVRTLGADFSVALENAGVQHLLRDEVRHTAYRIVQEGLTNAVKHDGGPVRASLRFGDELHLCVASGAASSTGGDIHALPIVPFTEHRQNVRHGLAGLRERVDAVNGSFECGTPPTGGFLLRARIPMVESAARWESRRGRWMRSAS